MKTISIFLALVNSLLAGLILAFSLSPSEIAQTAGLVVIYQGHCCLLGDSGRRAHVAGKRPSNPSRFAIPVQFVSCRTWRRNPRLDLPSHTDDWRYGIPSNCLWRQPIGAGHDIPVWVCWRRESRRFMIRLY